MALFPALKKVPLGSTVPIQGNSAYFKVLETYKGLQTDITILRAYSWE